MGISEVDADAGLEEGELAVVDAAADATATSVEHPADVGVEVPVQFAHEKAHSSAMDIAGVQVGVGEADACLKGAPRPTAAEIEIADRNKAFELSVDGVVWTAFAGQKPAGAGVEAIEIEVCAVGAADVGIDEFPLSG